MKLTNSDVFQTREPLQKLMAEKFPVMVSYKLAKMVSKLNDHLKVIEDVRNGLIKKYGKMHGNGQQSVKPEMPNPAFNKDDKKSKEPETLPNPDWPQFVEEFNELMAQEIEIEFDKVKLPEKVASTCDKCHHNMDKMYEVEASTLLALDKFIEVG